MEVQVLPGAPLLLRAAATTNPARALASPSGQGIGLTHRHSQVRVLERAPPIRLPGTLAQRRAPRPRASPAPRECPAGGEPIRNSQQSSPVAQRQSARPITGRPRFDTVRENHAPIAHARLAQPAERRPLKSEVRGSSPRSCTNSATRGRLRWSGRHPSRKRVGTERCGVRTVSLPPIHAHVSSRSSMAEPRGATARTRVRFPSAAPISQFAWEADLVKAPR